MKHKSLEQLGKARQQGDGAVIGRVPDGTPLVDGDYNAFAPQRRCCSPRADQLEEREQGRVPLGHLDCESIIRQPIHPRGRLTTEFTERSLQLV